MVSIATTVLSVTEVAPEVYQVDLAASPPPEYHPGQWASVHLPVGPHPPLVRAYSLAAPADGSGVLPLVFDVVEGGIGSACLAGVKRGYKVEIAGIFGKFVVPEPAPEELLFVARHTGIVPVRCIIASLAALPSPPRVTLVHGATSAALLLYRDEFAELARAGDWFRYHPTLLHREGPWDGPWGDEVSLLRALPASDGPVTPMVSGVREFTGPVRAYFMDERGLERRAVKVENFD